MRAVVLRGPGNYELADVVEPEPGPGEVLVAVEACGVCGSDVHLVDGSTVGRYPVVLGHEAAGRVVSCGPGVHGVTEGVRVAVLPYVGCGACRLCSLGQAQACARRDVLGVDRDGAQAELVVVPAECLVPLPDDVPSEIGAILTDAVATPWHAIRRSGVAAGDLVVVLGLGGLGMHTVQLLTEIVGCAVIGVDPRPEARRRALQLGAQAVVADAADVAASARDGRDGADAAFDMVGSPGLIDTALRCLRPQGRCVVVGITPDRLHLRMRQETVVARELSLIGSFGATRAEIEELAGLVAGGRLDLSHSVSGRFRPEDFGTALEETRAKRAGSVRVVITYS